MSRVMLKMVATYRVLVIKYNVFLRYPEAYASKTIDEMVIVWNCMQCKRVKFCDCELLEDQWPCFFLVRFTFFALQQSIFAYVCLLLTLSIRQYIRSNAKVIFYVLLHCRVYFTCLFLIDGSIVIFPSISFLYMRFGCFSRHVTLHSKKDV